MLRASFFVLGLVASYKGVKGDYDANCLIPNEWLKHQSDYDPQTFTDLTQCQQDALGLDQKNKIVLGGEGDSSAIGVELGSGGGGCDSGTECMEQCQALCCITKGCKIAMMHKDKDTTCYGSCDIYKEEETYFKCYLYSTGSKRSGSSVTSSCYTDPNAPNYDNCLSIAQTGFGWDKTTYDYMVGLQTCSSSSGKRLLAKTGAIKKVQVPLMGSKVTDKIKKKLALAKKFGARVRKAVEEAGGGKAFRSRLIKRLRK